MANSSISFSIAKHLLSIGAVELRPQEPFTWSSGIKSPIYCDNRVTLSYPEVRQEIAKGFQHVLTEQYSQADIVAGVATGGIAHAAFVAERTGLPMCYVRTSAKGHGKQNQVEGRLAEGAKVVVIEDLFSTGGSTLEAVKALREAGAEVLGVLAIFTYGFEKMKEAFTKAKVPYATLSHFQALIEVAEEEGYIAKEDIEELKNWDPFK